MKSLMRLWIATCISVLLVLPLTKGLSAQPLISKNSLDMVLVLLPAGQFEMGMLDPQRLKLRHKASAYQREIHDYVESPSFPVRLSKGFAISANEVTVGQFRRFVEATGYKTDAERAEEAWIFRPDAEEELGELGRFAPVTGANWRKPGFEQTDEHPVVCVSWKDAKAFCKWLSEKEGDFYRLPTEAEWEYACRAGTRTPYCCGEDPDDVYAYGNVADSALYAEHPEDVLRQRTVALEADQGDGFAYTAPAGSLRPNDWGLYDMHGNVWEWCSDKYSDRIYEELLQVARERGSRSDPEPVVDPSGPEDTPKHKHGDWRSLRGGSWYVAPLQCRSSVRAFAEAADAFSYIGFRVVREEETPR